jgi:deoxyribodipyrimidine photo-lyase
MSAPKILLYLIRHDIRLSDNPVFHEIASSFSGPDCKFTHLLPVYVFAASQIETSGLFSGPTNYAPARSRVGGFWRCGRHRAKFLGESVWALKGSLKAIGSDLSIRAGHLDQAVEQILEGVSKPGSPTPDSGSDRSASESGAKGRVVAVWMTGEKTTEEQSDERKIHRLAEKRGLEFRLFKDEKYYVDE